MSGQLSAANEKMVAKLRAKTQQKQVASPENWYPSFPDGTVKVSIIPDFDRQSARWVHTAWRVAVWGDDDFGLEREFPADAYHEALAVYDSIKEPVTQVFLKGLGFVRA